MNTYVIGFKKKKRIFTWCLQALKIICKKLARIIVQGVPDFLMSLYSMANKLFSESNCPWIIQN